MNSRTQGFTLLELMLVIAIASVVLVIGIPSFGEFSRNNRITAAANDFLGGVQTARTEAIKRQLTGGAVSVCPSNNPEATDAACLASGSRSFNGWLVFADTDGNCERAAGEQILRAGVRIDLENNDTRFLKTNSDGVCISFLSTGFTRAKVGDREPARHIIFCDDRGIAAQKGMDTLSTARGIEITQTGRARITRDLKDIGDWTVGCAP